MLHFPRRFVPCLLLFLCVILRYPDAATAQSNLTLIKGVDFAYSGLVGKQGNNYPDVTNWTWSFMVKPYGDTSPDNVTTNALFVNGSNTSVSKTVGGYTFTIPANLQANLTAPRYKMVIYATGTGFAGTVTGGVLQVTAPTTGSTVDLSGVLAAEAGNQASNNAQTGILNSVNQGVANANQGITSLGTAMTGLQSSVNTMVAAENTVTPPSTSAFPNGAAHPIPGILIGSDYDNGSVSAVVPGTGTAANFPLNGGGTVGLTYRADVGNANLKTEDDATTSNLYIVGFLAAGSYMNYTCTVAATTSQYFDIGLRVQSNQTGALCHVEIDGNNVTASVPVQNLGVDTLTSWQTVDAGTYVIAPGPHVIRFVVDAPFMDLNQITFTSVAAPTGSTLAAALPMPAVGTTGAAVNVTGAAPTVGNWYKAGQATLQVTALGTPSGGNTPVTFFNGGATGNSGVATLGSGTALTSVAAPTTGMYAVMGTTGTPALYVYGLAVPPMDARLNPANPLPQTATNAGNTVIYVAQRADGFAGSGATASDPYDGSTQAKFDTLVSTKGSNFTWHIAKGNYSKTGGGGINAGQQLFGAGMDQTVVANVTNKSSVFSNSGSTDNFDLFDMTLDCTNNGAVQQGTGANGRGNHFYLSRLHCINWHTNASPPNGDGSECFPVFSFGDWQSIGVTWSNVRYDHLLFDRPLPITNTTANVLPNQDGNTICSMFAALNQGHFDEATCKCLYCYAGPNITPYFVYSHGFEAPEVAYCTTDGVYTGIYDEPEHWGPTGHTSNTDNTNHNWHDNLFIKCQEGYHCHYSQADGRETGTNIFQNNTVDNTGLTPANNHNALAKITTVATTGTTGLTYPSYVSLTFKNNIYKGQMGSSDVPLDIDPIRTSTVFQYGTLVVTGNTITYSTTAGPWFRLYTPSVTPGPFTSTGNVVNGVSNNATADQ